MDHFVRLRITAYRYAFTWETILGYIRISGNRYLITLQFYYLELPYILSTYFITYNYHPIFEQAFN
jgi:hypothetical protein